MKGLAQKRNTPPSGGNPCLFWRIHDTALNIITVTLLCGILLLMVLQIVTRYVFSNPLKWTEELMRNCLLWLTFSGSIVMVRQNASICIDSVVNLLPKKLQKALWLFTNGLSAVFFLILAWYGFRFVRMNLGTRSLVTHFNMGIVYLVIPLSALLMLLNLLRAMKEAPEWKS